MIFLHHSISEPLSILMVIALFSIFTITASSTRITLNLLRKIILTNDQLTVYSHGLLSHRWQKQLVINRDDIDFVEVVNSPSSGGSSESNPKEGKEVIFKWYEHGQLRTYPPMWGSHSTTPEEFLATLNDLATKAPKFPLRIQSPLSSHREVPLKFLPGD